MPSSYTSRSRFVKQATGEGVNVWGEILNSGALELIDAAMDGWVTLAASTTLSQANGADDQARRRVLKATAAITITIPELEKLYLVWATNGDVVVTNGTASVTVKSGDFGFIATDGPNIGLVRQTDFGGGRIKGVGTPVANADAATKGYVDGLAFSTALPGQAGNAGKFVTTDGTEASWVEIDTGMVAGLGDALDAKADQTDLDALGDDVTALDGAAEKIAARASASEIRSNANKHLSTNEAWSSVETQTLTYASSYTLNFSQFINAKMDLNGNITFSTSNLKDGQKGRLKLKQNGTGSNIATWPASFRFASPIKTLSTAPNAEDYLYMDVAESVVICNLVRAPSA